MPKKQTNRAAPELLATASAAGVLNDQRADEERDACGWALSESESVADEALPEALGGVAFDAPTPDEACGCDLEFDDFNATSDEELPEATGGVV